MVHVRDQVDSLRQSGGSVVAVGMGSMEQTALFLQQFDLSFPMLCDPERVVFRKYGLEEASLATLASLKVWVPSIKAILRRGTAMPVGDIRQMSGELVIDRRGRVRLVHYSANQADFPSWAEVHQALEAAGGTSPDDK